MTGRFSDDPDVEEFCALFIAEAERLFNECLAEPNPVIRQAMEAKVLWQAASTAGEEYMATSCDAIELTAEAEDFLRAQDDSR